MRIFSSRGRFLHHPKRTNRTRTGSAISTTTVSCLYMCFYSQKNCIMEEIEICGFPCRNCYAVSLFSLYDHLVAAHRNCHVLERGCYKFYLDLIIFRDIGGATFADVVTLVKTFSIFVSLLLKDSMGAPRLQKGRDLLTSSMIHLTPQRGSSSCQPGNNDSSYTSQEM